MQKVRENKIGPISSDTLPNFGLSPSPSRSLSLSVSLTPLRSIIFLLHFYRLHVHVCVLILHDVWVLEWSEISISRPLKASKPNGIITVKSILAIIVTFLSLMFFIFLIIHSSFRFSILIPEASELCLLTEVGFRSGERKSQNMPYSWNNSYWNHNTKYSASRKSEISNKSRQMPACSMIHKE